MGSSRCLTTTASMAMMRRQDSWTSAFLGPVTSQISECSGSLPGPCHPPRSSLTLKEIASSSATIQVSARSTTHTHYGWIRVARIWPFAQAQVHQGYHLRFAHLLRRLVVL